MTSYMGTSTTIQEPPKLVETKVQINLPSQQISTLAIKQQKMVIGMHSGHVYLKNERSPDLKLIMRHKAAVTGVWLQESRQTAVVASCGHDGVIQLYCEKKNKVTEIYEKSGKKIESIDMMGDEEISEAKATNDHHWLAFGTADGEFHILQPGTIMLAACYWDYTPINKYRGDGSRFEYD
jgi:hypothetical protein